MEYTIERVMHSDWLDFPRDSLSLDCDICRQVFFYLLSKCDSDLDIVQNIRSFTLVEMYHVKITLVPNNKIFMALSILRIPFIRHDTNPYYSHGEQCMYFYRGAYYDRLLPTILTLDGMRYYPISNILLKRNVSSQFTFMDIPINLRWDYMFCQRINCLCHEYLWDLVDTLGIDLVNLILDCFPLVLGKDNICKFTGKIILFRTSDISSSTEFNRECCLCQPAIFEFIENAPNILYLTLS